MTGLLLSGLAAAIVLTQAQSVKVPPASPAQPYQELFQTRPLDVVASKDRPVRQDGARVARRAPSDRSAVERGACNMPVVRANPGVDPKMILPRNPRAAEAKARIIEPRTCWEK